MFDRKCPCCKERIKFSYIKKMVNEISFKCPYCRKNLKIKTSDTYVNSVLLGAAVALVGVVLHWEVNTIIVIGALTSIFMQKYLDIFFALEEEKSNY